MNPKLERISCEIGKIKVKMTSLQARLRELERQKTELENAELIAIIRKEKLSEDEFKAFIKQITYAKAQNRTAEEIGNEE